MEEKARELRSEAMMASAEGEPEKAVELLTSAILSNPKSALLYAKRARFVLTLSLWYCSPVLSYIVQSVREAAETECSHQGLRRGHQNEP